MDTTAPAPATDFISNLFGGLTGIYSTYIQGQLAHDTTQTELALYQAQLEAQQQTAAKSAGLQGLTTSTVAGVPVGFLLLGALAIFGVMWASKH